MQLKKLTHGLTPKCWHSVLGVVSSFSPVHFLFQQHGVQTALHELLGHRLVVAVEGHHLGRHLPEDRVILPDDAAAEHRGRLDVERQHLRDAAELEGMEGGLSCSSGLRRRRRCRRCDVRALTSTGPEAGSSDWSRWGRKTWRLGHTASSLQRQQN